MTKGPVSHAMILAAGMGTRMRPLTDDRPKPLVRVMGRPLIDHALDRIREAGITDCVVNIHFRGAQLRDHLADRTDLKITISDETDALLDTGGGVVKALPLLGNGSFLYHNSDTIWLEENGSNIRRLIEAFDPERMDALMLLAPMVNACGFDGKGDFFMGDDGRLAFRGEAPHAPYAWAGVQMVHPRLFRDPPEGAFSTKILWERSIGEDRLFGLRLDGFWMHVGTPDGVKEAEQRIKDAERPRGSPRPAAGPARP